MRIVYDIPRLQAEPLGMQSYLENVLRAAVTQLPDDWSIGIASHGLKGKANHSLRLSQVDPGKRATHRWTPLPATLNDLFVRSRCLNPAPLTFGGANLVHTFGFSWTPSGKYRLVATIQDVIPITCNEASSEERVSTKKRLEYLAHACDAITTVSEFSKGEIVAHLKVPESKVHVICDGIDLSRFSPPTAGSEQIASRLLAKLGLSRPYILHTGGRVPRKNTARLVEAFSAFKKKYGLNHQLAFAGSSDVPADFGVAIERSACKQDIKVLPYLSSADLLTLVQGADIFAFPSVYEGFGMPPLEAMACGVPVVASQLPPMNEILGDAAVYFDPFDPEAIGSAIGTLAEDQQLRATCIERGFLQAERYKTHNAFATTVKLYETLLGAPLRKCSDTAS